MLSFYYDRSVDLKGGKSQVQGPGDKGESYDVSNTSFPVAVSVGENDNVMIFAPLNTIIFRILQRLNIVNMA